MSLDVLQYGPAKQMVGIKQGGRTYWHRPGPGRGVVGVLHVGTYRGNLPPLRVGALTRKSMDSILASF